MIDINPEEDFAMSCFWIQGLALSVTASAVQQTPPAPTPHATLDVLALAGFMFAIIQLACFAQQHHSSALLFGLGLSSMAMAVYAGLQGAWPLGLIQVVWAVASFRRWHRQIRVAQTQLDSAASDIFWPIPTSKPKRVVAIDTESRLTRMFGPL
jgi:hypothetical protein